MGDERVTDGPAPRVFDMPHARVTLSRVGPGVEIEVWPKAGQSAYAVVDPRVAILIAQQLVELAAAQLVAAQPMATTDVQDPAEDAVDEGSEGPGQDNVVDLASRRAPGGRAG